ncbi:hypothetical protein ACN4EK_27915 [Pantanalinema rosaneae CENA516]|uniref:hypothetical protein n=1 Tax=Pantanalinema rosaneae TaxID=1620701 RepID=UPI003D70100F
MSGSLCSKGSMIIHAIAITTALSIVSGYLSPQTDSIHRFPTPLNLNANTSAQR